MTFSILLPLFVCTAAINCGNAQPNNPAESGNTPEKKIQRGMSDVEVKAILGMPDTSINYNASEFVWYYYPKERNDDKTRIPFVLFGSGKKVVVSTHENGVYFNGSSRNAEQDTIIERRQVTGSTKQSSTRFYFSVLSSTYETVHFRQLEKKLFVYIDSSCGVDSIRVYKNGSTELVQTIITDENSYCPYDGKFLTIEDMNFDTYEDISMVQGTTAGPNTPSLYWLYDSATGKYIRNTELEEISSATFDQKRQVITSSWRSNAATYGLSTYKYIGDKIVLIEEVKEHYEMDGHITYTLKKRLNGKLVTVLKERNKKSKLNE